MLHSVRAVILGALLFSASALAQSYTVNPSASACSYLGICSALTVPSLTVTAGSGIAALVFPYTTCTSESYGMNCSGGEWVFPAGVVTGALTVNSVGVFNTNGPIEWGGVGTGFQLGLTNGASYGTYALSIFSDTLTTLQWGVTPAGETVTKSIVVGTGTQITNHCASTQGACSMATASSCTATCSGCTTATSVCWSSPFSNAATSDAVGVKAVCSTAGTVTLTAVTASVGTETLNVFCDN